MQAETRRTARALSQSLDEMIERRVEFLTAYQNAAYAQPYRALRRARAAAKSAVTGRQSVDRSGRALSLQADGLQGRVRSGAAVHTDRVCSSASGRSSTAIFQLHFHLAPPLLAKRDPVTGELQKREYGQWIFTAFRLLAACADCAARARYLWLHAGAPHRAAIDPGL